MLQDLIVISISKFLILAKNRFEKSAIFVKIQQPFAEMRWERSWAYLGPLRGLGGLAKLANFAKNGNPNGDNLPQWPLHKNRNWMKFTANTGENSEAIKYLREEKLDALEEGLLLLLAKLEKTHTVGK